jgi:hypothetical protein
MKRIVAAGLAALVYSVLMPLVALAQEGQGSGFGPPEGPTVSGSGGGVAGGAGAGAGGTAFTGAEVAGLVVLATVLAGVGIVALVASRRRAAARA